MTRPHLTAAALALTSFVALAGCSSGGNHDMAQSHTTAPMPQTAAAAPMPAAAPMSTPVVSPRLIRRVQVALRQQGLYKGHLDGVWGPKTEGAVQGYQQAHGLTVTGELDQPTLDSMKTADATPMMRAPAAGAMPAPMDAAPTSPKNTSATDPTASP